MRCQSVVITEKEKTLLIKQSDKKGSSQEAKVASKGFVRSMCKFYSDIIGGGDQGRPRRSVLDRSHSFGAVKEVKEALNIKSCLFCTGDCQTKPLLDNIVEVVGMRPFKQPLCAWRGDA